jgi:hypothetical protein
VKSDRSVYLDGERLAVGLDEDVFAYFAILADQYPSPITFPDMKKQSPDLQGVNQTRLKHKIPAKLADLVEIVQNKGHVFRLPE